MKYIENMDEFNKLLETSKTKLVVVDFTASWCGTSPFTVVRTCQHNFGL